jgi:hypothetical protein
MSPPPQRSLYGNCLCGNNIIKLFKYKYLSKTEAKNGQIFVRF